MKLADRNLLFGLTVYLHSVGLMRAQIQLKPAVPTHLEDLFPASSGIHLPDIEKLAPADVEFNSDFTTLNGSHMSKQALIYFKRSNVIFGYTSESAEDIIIENLGQLFGRPYLWAVFDTTHQQWWTLPYLELQRLGVTRSLPLVLGHDESHALLHKFYHQQNPKAHNAASNLAYIKTQYEEQFNRNPKVDLAERVENIKKQYYKNYNEEYQRHAGGLSDGR